MGICYYKLLTIDYLCNILSNLNSLLLNKEVNSQQ